MTKRRRLLLISHDSNSSLDWIQEQKCQFIEPGNLARLIMDHFSKVPVVSVFEDTSPHKTGEEKPILQLQTDQRGHTVMTNTQEVLSLPMKYFKGC